MPGSISNLSGSLTAASTLEGSSFRPMRETSDSTFTGEWLWNDDQTRDERNWELARILLQHRHQMKITSQHGLIYRGRFKRPDSASHHYLIFFELNPPGYEKVTYCFKTLSATNEAIEADMKDDWGRFDEFKPLMGTYFELYDSEDAWPTIVLSPNDIGVSLWH